ncbi:thioredoxin-like protein [Basidiobolus meristosporus CBS 931.73]|uniref:Thioredoxin-like protein n=1 Tax=Basidiobolus meristosporus CBS 931.73 TaxID=1314790 RepID=A0A1Y1YY95_9FUNG|nr:thioredoxin-like protein [Basidiobolus meristosporus CBS 931.73]|eukprot:ORY02916.1 thioredoxin-like protein [Basidiobolus meristosporus CBS 931.73]
MPVKIYSFKQALWPGPVRLTLAEKNITDIEVVEVDLPGGENFSPEYLRINANGTVPALVNSETNKILDDSTTITEYLDEKYPGTELYPASDRAAITHWIKETHRIDGNFLAFSPADPVELEQKRAFVEGFFGGRVKALTEFIQKQDTPFYHEKLGQLKSILVAYEHPEQAQPLFDLHRAEWQKAESYLDQLDAQLASGPYIVGEKYTSADVHAIPLLVRLKSVKGDVVLEGRPNIQRYLAKVASRENFKSVYGTL